MYYMLRKTMIPWRVDETIHETLAYCVANNIDEVIWKIDVEEFCAGFTSLELIKKYIPMLKKAKVMFDAEKKSTSINPWMTLNHSGYMQNSVAEFPAFQWMVDSTGKQSTASPCPLCGNWQEHLLRAYKTYAEVTPHILWVEDDLRHFNHGIVQWGCFCQLHIDQFSKTLGKTVYRQELVNALLKCGKPHPYRQKWMDFLGQNMVQLAGKLEKAVHNVSPLTKIGLMSSCPDHHSVEGRRWHDLLKSFSGPDTPVLRPHFGPYRSESVLDMFRASDILRQTTYCVPVETMICPEVENLPYSEFSKSVKQTRAQILLSAALGYSNITLNLYDHLGTALDKNDRYGVMLKETKLHTDKLLPYCKTGGTLNGIGILCDPDAAKYMHTECGKNFSELYARGNGWSIPLQVLGHGIAYGAQEVTAITGQITRAYNDLQIKQILSGGVLLDASAAKTLVETGYGQHIGVAGIQKCKRIDMAIAVEDCPDFGYMPARIECHEECLYRLSLFADAHVFSNFLDPQRAVVMPSLIFYQNEFGGKIAVYARDLDFDFPNSFLNWNRKKQIKQVIDWLGEGGSLYVESMPYCLPIRIDYDTYSVIMVMNTGHDNNEISFQFNTAGRKVKEIAAIQPGDSSAPCSFQQLGNQSIKVISNISLNNFEAAIFCVFFSRE